MAFAGLLFVKSQLFAQYLILLPGHCSRNAVNLLPDSKSGQLLHMLFYFTPDPDFIKILFFLTTISPGGKSTNNPAGNLVVIYKYACL